MPDPLPPTVLQADGVPITAHDPDAPAFRPPLAADELGVLAGYRVQRLLGKGGMGAVYLALDDGLRRQVALKVMLPRYAADADASERFRREARAAAAVRHDNVVTVYQVGEDCGVPFLAMERLTGYPLDDYLKRKGRLTVAQALRVGTETALGLAAAHALGLIHRDIKPANLWLEAPQGRIKILDFGLAKPLAGEPGESTELTGRGAVMGTPAYMSPEQTRGGAVDARSDLFSLGVVLYQLCTGARPFDRATAMATAVAVASDEPTPVRDLNPDVPAAVAAVIHALLAKSPAQRPQTAAEVARRLRELERTGGAAPVDVTAAPAAPQVVYVPIQVTAYEPGASAFADLDLTETNDPTVPPQSPAPEAPARPRPGFPWWAVAVSAALLAAGGGAVVYYANRPKPVEVAPAENKDGPRPGPGTRPTVVARTDPQREFAVWAFSQGGEVEVLDRAYKAEKDLPPGPLAVTGVSFALADCRYEPTDADIDLLVKCPDLVKLQFRVVRFSDAGFAKLVGAFAPRLKYLSLQAPGLSPGVLASLGTCKALDTLHISGVPRLSGRVGFLADLPKLWNFSSHGGDLTDDDLAALKGASLRGLVVNDNARVTPAGLEHLAKSRACLSELNVSGTGVKGRAGAEAIARFDQLASLTVAKLDLTDDDVALFRELKLNILYLNDNPLTDRCAETISTLSKLRTLLLIRAGVSDVGLKRLHANKELALVHLDGTAVTLEGVKSLMDAVPGCAVKFDYDAKADPDRRLAEWLVGTGGGVALVNVAGVVTDTTKLPPGPLRVGVVYWPGADKKPHPLTDAELDYFRDTRVYHFSMGTRHAFTDAGLKTLCEFPNAGRFKVLSLGSPKVTPDGYKHLTKLPALEQLDLEYLKVPDAVLAVCGGIKTLKRMNLQEGAFTDAGLAHLSGLPLTHLNLAQTATGDAGLKALAGVTTLEKLTLHSTKVTDAGLAHLSGMTQLTWLDLSATAVTADGLKAVVALPALQRLELAGNAKLTDAGLVHLVGAKSLTWLNLNGTGVTNDGMRLVAALPALETLHIAHTAIGDAGLRMLINMTALKELDVRGSKVTDPGRLAFQRALPNCEFKRN